ncbi:endonuclease III [Acuticoccus sp. I52.16.1]|nr:endonuclease III [Acuticoccus sp. I52.16.1]UOM36910.1 endonuclease III [Acuticoccus sp. I52.16.1]
MAAEAGHPPGGLPGEAPAEPAKATPAKATPAKATPAKATPAKATPAKATPAKATPAKATPAKATPAKAPAKPKTLKNSRYTKAEADALFQRLADALPEPRTELEYTNPYTLLVAVALSAQATDVGVNKATRALFPVADTPRKMVALGEERLREFIKTIGLFNTKAKNVIALSQALIDTHGGEVPKDRAALQALPGVGRKTANVVLNVAFGEPTIAVDTHIFRIGNRLGLAPGKTPDDVEKALEKIVPERFLRGAHHWLILHGRHVCKARRPLCEACVIYELCKAPDRRALPHA